MNSSELEGNWAQFKGKVKAKWGKLTDDDLDRIEGRREELIGRIQERYGKSRDATDQEVNEFLRTLH